jgi:hypothetical protein
MTPMTSKQRMLTGTRREFLRAGLAGAAGLISTRMSMPGPAVAAEPAGGVCVTLCNHWSYIGIGWQLGIESCVLSVTDAMEMADRAPHVKTCINLDARAYELMAEKFPEVAERLKKYLAAGKVELIGGTYGQPMGTMFSGESNIRQIVVGRETIRKALDYEMVTFLEEEEFTHPQIPQIVAGAGFRFASLAQMDTWGRAGCPKLEFNAIAWKGIDGTAIPTIPKNSLFGYSPDLKKLASSPAFQKLAALGKPLLFTWEEFGWESPEQPSYLSAPAKYREFAKMSPIPVEFVTCGEYLDKYGSHPQETIYVPMDAWGKSLTWGLGGDQLRILDRKVEGLLVAAERFDAVASSLGEKPHDRELEKAWKDVLASQSHDVGLCEYSRWQGARMAPLDRIEDRHNFTWGAIGYNHLDAAQKQGQAVLDEVLGQLSARIHSPAIGEHDLLATVFNPSGSTRGQIVQTGRIYPIPPKTRQIIVKDRSGRAMPTQIVKCTRDGDGSLVMADVAFRTDGIAPVGYDTYALELASETSPLADSDLRADPSRLVLENEHLRVSLHAATGGISSLIDKHSGQEFLNPQAGPFPAFRGRPSPSYPLRPKPPTLYDSTQSTAQIQWLADGPVLATVRAQHAWPGLEFETRVSLGAGDRHVEVLIRMLTFVPPQADSSPADIKEGYWVSFTPAFEPVSVVRDFPFGIEPTGKPAFHALTFVDLMGRQSGLLLLHAGTQWFRREENNGFSNLLMREWATHFDKEYGWPIYTEYRHALQPHAGPLSHADCLQAATAFCQPLRMVVGPPRTGALPPAKGFVQITPDHVQLSALRKKAGAGLELRVVEVGGKEGQVIVALDVPATSAVETDLLGRKIEPPMRQGGRLSFPIQPWKIKTFEVS